VIRAAVYALALVALAFMVRARKTASLRAPTIVLALGLAIDVALAVINAQRGDRTPYHVAQSIALAWPWLVAWLALGVDGHPLLWRTGPLVALWGASLAACIYVWPGDPSRVYVAAQGAMVAISVGAMLRAGTKLGRFPLPGETATAALVLVEVASLIVPYFYALAAGSTPTAEWPGGYAARAAGYVVLCVIAWRACSRSSA